MGDRRRGNRDLAEIFTKEVSDRFRKVRNGLDDEREADRELFGKERRLRGAHAVEREVQRLKRAGAAQRLRRLDAVKTELNLELVFRKEPDVFIAKQRPFVTTWNCTRWPGRRWRRCYPRRRAA